MPSLSIVIPAYNEETRLGPTIAKVDRYLQGRSESFEILVVDDGSTDRTATFVRELSKVQPHLHLISYPANKGKGFAVRSGMLAAAGDLLLQYDADGSTPIEELSKLEKAITAGADIAIGSRNIKSNDSKVVALPHRKIMGNTFNALVQALLLPGIRDTQCGCKLFTREAARKTFAAVSECGFAFDTEALVIARNQGMRIDEIAVNWEDMPGSKVNLGIDSFKMFQTVVKLAFSAKHPLPAVASQPVAGQES